MLVDGDESDPGMSLMTSNYQEINLETWCEELTHLKRPWCWERLEVGGEGDNKGWDGWMASPTQWTWVWVNSGSWWWTGRPGIAAVRGVAKSQTWLSGWTELSWTWRQTWRPNKLIIPHSEFLLTWKGSQNRTSKCHLLSSSVSRNHHRNPMTWKNAQSCLWEAMWSCVSCPLEAAFRWETWK